MSRALLFALLVVGCDEQAPQGPLGEDPSADPSNPDPPTDPSDPADPGPGGLGDGASVDDLHRSGSRIKRRILEGDDGSKTFLGFWDNRFDGPCGYADDGTGTWRCLPSHTAQVYSEASMRYGDDACQGPRLAQVTRGSCGFGPEPTAGSRSRGCGLRDWFELGAQHTGNIYVKEHNGECGEGVPIHPTNRYYVITRDLSLTDFVEAVEVIE